MAEPYLTRLNELIGRLVLEADLVAAVRSRHFFSGAAAYIDGKIFMTLTPVGLALKLPQADCSSRFADGAKPLQHFPNAPIKKNYVILSKTQISNRDKFTRWVLAGITFVRIEA